VIRHIGQFWFITKAPGGAFYGYPWPTRQDAQEALEAVLQGHIAQNYDGDGYDIFSKDRVVPQKHLEPME
jgi:hypothetical protein